MHIFYRIIRNIREAYVHGKQMDNICIKPILVAAEFPIIYLERL